MENVSRWIRGCLLRAAFSGLGQRKIWSHFSNRPPWPHGGARVNAFIWASHRLPLRKETTLEEEDIGEQRNLLANSLLGPLPPRQ